VITIWSSCRLFLQSQDSRVTCRITYKRLLNFSARASRADLALLMLRLRSSTSSRQVLQQAVRRRGARPHGGALQVA
jgi:hypothetical protein